MAETFESLIDLFDHSTSQYANHELFGIKERDGWRYLTYREMRSMVDTARGALAGLGVEPGDRVAVIADNRLEWAVLAYATYGRRAAFVPMYQSQAVDELEFILADSGAKVVFAATAAIYEAVEQRRDKLPALEHLVGLDLPNSDEHSYGEFMRRGANNPVDTMTPSSDEAAGFVYTSGTTGKPKGVILTHANICANVAGALARFQIKNDRSLAFLPWAHSLGQTGELHTLLASGNSMAINDDLTQIVANLAEVKPTVLVAVPRIFNRIYDGVQAQMAHKPKPIQALFRSGIAAAVKRSSGESLGLLESTTLTLADRLIFSKIREKFGGRLKFVICGSAALNPEVAQFIDALGIIIYEGYGLTEASPVVSVNYPGHRKIGSVGPPLPGMRVEIDKSRSPEGDQGQDGELVVYGPSVMKGYHNRPEEDAAIFTEDRGLRTGDLGHLDADGFVYITGRIKEQYKLENGKYVAPAPLEERLKLSPYVANAMVYGDNKPYNVALIVPDMAALTKWAEGQGRTLGDIEANNDVQHLLQAECDRLGTTFKGYERPRRIAVIKDDFTIEEGLLTPSLKLKRPKVVGKYQAELDALYP